MSHKRALFSLIFLVVPLAFGLRPAMSQHYTIGSLEGGSFWLFSDTLKAVKQFLDAEQWSTDITFAADAQRSPGWEQPHLLEQEAQALMNRDDLDLIIAMGTDATRALLEANNHHTPIVAMAVSDPIGSKFVASAEDSGIDNFTVRLDLDRFPRMFEIFHQVVEFERLGLIFPDTQSGRQFTNLAEARSVAAQRGFEIIEYAGLTDESTQDCRAGLDDLIQQGIDAFFIPSLVCFDWQQSDVDTLLSHLRDAGVATFARNGSQDVMGGALMGFSTVDFSRRGQFLAQMIINILQGTSPRSLNMVDTGIPKISFNLAVAHEIGFNPPFDILAATDELYQDIILPDANQYSHSP